MKHKMRIFNGRSHRRTMIASTEYKQYLEQLNETLRVTFNTDLEAHILLLTGSNIDVNTDYSKYDLVITMANYEVDKLIYDQIHKKTRLIGIRTRYEDEFRINFINETVELMGELIPINFIYNSNETDEDIIYYDEINGEQVELTDEEDKLLTEVVDAELGNEDELDYDSLSKLKLYELREMFPDIKAVSKDKFIELVLNRK